MANFRWPLRRGNLPNVTNSEGFSKSILDFCGVTYALRPFKLEPDIPLAMEGELWIMKELENLASQVNNRSLLADIYLFAKK